jgi:hypothetical protein
MGRHFRWAAPFALFATLHASPQQPAPLDRSDLVGRPATFDIAQGDVLEIRGGTGSLIVTRAKGMQAMVTAVRPSGDEPRVETIRHDKGVTICSVYQSPNPKKPNECRPQGKGRLGEGVRITSPPVNYRVELPDGVRLWSDFPFGDFKVNAGASDLDLDVFHGSISLVDHGSKNIRVKVIGSAKVDASIFSPSEIAGDRRADFSIGGGELRIGIPRSLSLHYSIMSDMPPKSAFPLAKPVGSLRSGVIGSHPNPSTFLYVSTGSLLANVSLLARSDIQ